MHYKRVADTAFMHGARAVYQHLGNARGFPQSIVNGKDIVTVVTIASNDGGEPKVRLCRDVLRNSYALVCGLFAEPLIFDEVKGN